MIDYVSNIQSLSDAIVALHGVDGSGAVRAVFARYDAIGIDDLRPSKVTEVYAELYQLYLDS